MTVIAIDGPAGAGKSTIARELAERLHMAYLDTGAMYRAVALVALSKQLALNDEVAMTKVATEMKIQLLDERVDGKLIPKVVVNGLDATKAIRTPQVAQASSAVAVHPSVRDRLVKRQRYWVEEVGDAVVEGRDIGTVVLPSADLKIYLNADEEERMRRRQNDSSAVNFQQLTPMQVRAELDERDARDANRAASPLRAAPDALIIDTTNQDIEDVLLGIIAELRKRYDGELPMGTRK